MLTFKLGKRPPAHDVRVPRFSAMASRLPPPPPESNWYAEIGSWLVLGNDVAGCCVDSAAFHFVMQMSAYANPGHGLKPTAAEALAAYSATTGYDPHNPATDLGTYVLGPGGFMAYWLQHGITVGGVLNKCQGYLSLDIKNPIELRHGINICGGVMLGLELPESVIAKNIVPFVWRHGGPIAGGHEVLAVGYLSVAGQCYYDIISWGEHYRIPEPDLLAMLDEAVCVVDDVSINARGVNAAGLDRITLASRMAAIRNA
jgi:hypothetical protein